MWELFEGHQQIKKAAPVGVILTIPAAGSESSNGAVITEEEGMHKCGYCSDLLYPKFAMLDPQLCFTLPNYQISAGGVDIMAHVMERYFVPDYNHDFSDRMCEAAMVSLVHHLPKVLKNKADYESWSEIMWIGSVAHNGLFGKGKCEDWASHEIEHQLSAHYDIAHGAGLAVVFPAWMKYVWRALRSAKERFPELYYITDVCLCEYTSHGHCGMLCGHEVENDSTLELLAKTALSHAQAGADMVAPSDMMDGRILALRRKLDQNGYKELPIMSYAVKYTSAFYGPFREAAGSAPAFGDRKSYQMAPHNSREGVKEALLDVEEGADILMVKPALSYGDMITKVRETTNLPVAAYSVSGEYAMVKAAAANGWVDEERIMCEMAVSAYRAGAKKKLMDMLDKLDVSDKHYDRKYQDMQDRLDTLYDKISDIEDAITDINEKIHSAYSEHLTAKCRFVKHLLH